MAWYDQLFTDLKAYAAAVATDVKTILPRLLPAGGSDGQVLAKNGAADYATKWITPASSGSVLTNPDSLNGFLQSTDRLQDCTTSAGFSSRQGYFHQVVAERSHLVGGLAYRINRSGSVSGGWLSNAVGILDTAGNPLATADAAGTFGSEGWKRVYFTTPVPLTAGQRYVLAILASGDNIPGFLAANGYNEYNTGTPANLPRCFKKREINTLATAVTFDSSVEMNNWERVFIALIPPAS
jgi:hypothetical protein